MSTIQSLQQKINAGYQRAFGRTPLQQRLDDILGEAMELHRYTDMANMREEAGDLLGSLLQLMNENGWDAESLATENLTKIKRREAQYRGLGRKVKVAGIGGAFNCITDGHIKLAQFVLDTSKTFDEVWLIPCYQHMYGKKLAAAKHRLKMCELAAQVDGRIKVCDFEIRNKLRGETYHMVKKFLETDFGKNQVDLSLVIGMDNANTFDQWVNYRDLERMIRFVVVPRTGEIRKKGVDWYLKPPHLFLEPEQPLPEMSSTIIRNALGLYWSTGAIHPALEEGLDPKVLEYILNNKLYCTRKKSKKQ